MSALPLKADIAGLSFAQAGAINIERHRRNQRRQQDHVNECNNCLETQPLDFTNDVDFGRRGGQQTSPHTPALADREMDRDLRQRRQRGR